MRKDFVGDNVISTGKLNSIYRGTVEDNKDPWTAGRCRIRVFGIHSDSLIQTSKDGIPTAELPWAEPAGPIFGGSSGIGMYGIPVQGAQVFLFFESGDLYQPRYFATALGIPFGGKTASNTVGFSDPDGEYPTTEKSFEPDYNTGSGPSDYTKVFMIGGHCGHKIIFDSTPSNENIVIKHGTSGAYVKFDVDGSIQIHCAPSAATYDSAEDRNIVTTGHHSLRVSKNLVVSSKESMETVGGNKDSQIWGARSDVVDKNWTMMAEGISINASGESQFAASGKNIIAAGDDCVVKSSDKNVVAQAIMGDVKLKALIGKIQGESLTIDMKATITADFGGTITTLGGTTSCITMVTGQMIMIG